MLVAGAAGLLLPDAAKQESTITFWAEWIALGAFGVAWFVAGKVLRLIADEDERLKLSLRRSTRAG